MLRGLSTEWRELTAGSEGFLTGGRRGMEGQQVVWGEMDSFVRARRRRRLGRWLSRGSVKGGPGPD